MLDLLVEPRQKIAGFHDLAVYPEPDEALFPGFSHYLEMFTFFTGYKRREYRYPGPFGHGHYLVEYLL